MAPSDSEPCTQRPPAAAAERQPAAARDDPAVAASSEERAPAAGTSTTGPNEAASLQAPAEAAAEKKKQDRAAAAAPEEPARRPEESARERLKRHRTEMAGRVCVPDMWGQERLLKDWVECAVFDRPLAATAGLLTARDALVAECAAARRPAGVVVPHGSAGRPLRVQNGCS